MHAARIESRHSSIIQGIFMILPVAICLSAVFMVPALKGEALAQECNIKTIEIYPYVEDRRITINFSYNKDWANCRLHAACTLKPAGHAEISAHADLENSYQGIFMDIPPDIKKASFARLRCTLTGKRTWKISSSVKLPGTSRDWKGQYLYEQQNSNAPVHGRKVIRKKNGVYITDARINGRKVLCMIDTGASILTIGRKQAMELGIKYDSAREIPVITASGLHNAYPARLSSVSVGNVEVRDVDALISSNDYPPIILLGMSFLDHVHVSMKKNKIILEK